MSDTLTFIGKLLRSSKTEQDWFYARQIPTGVFKDDAKFAVWVFNYREKHGRYPSTAAFEKRFNGTDLPRTKEPLADILQSAIDTQIFSSMTEAIEATKRKLDDGSTISDALELFRAKVSAINQWSLSSTDLTFGSTDISETRYRERVQSSKLKGTGLNFTPWPDMNELLGFVEPGEHIVLAARTSIGKTWVALFWADYLASLGETVLIDTREMTVEQCHDRLESIRHRLDYGLFRRAMLSPVELRRYYLSRRAWKGYPNGGSITITGTETLKGSGFDNLFQKIETVSPTVVILDGAYLLYPPAPDGGRFNSDVQRFTVISSTAKRVAKVKKLVFMSVIQSNRDGETKEGDTKPTLKDLYGADAWAQDADRVLLLGGRRGSPFRDLALAKSRDSTIGEVKLSFTLNPPSIVQTGGAAPLLAGDVSVFKAA